MSPDDDRPGRRQPPWWLMPAVMNGLGIAALAPSAAMMKSAVMITIVE